MPSFFHIYIISPDSVIFFFVMSIKANFVSVTSKGFTIIAATNAESVEV